MTFHGIFHCVMEQILFKVLSCAHSATKSKARSSCVTAEVRVSLWPLLVTGFNRLLDPTGILGLQVTLKQLQKE